MVRQALNLPTILVQASIFLAFLVCAIYLVCRLLRWLCTRWRRVLIALIVFAELSSPVWILPLYFCKAKEWDITARMHILEWQVERWYAAGPKTDYGWQIWDWQYRQYEGGSVLEIVVHVSGPLKGTIPFDVYESEIFYHGLRSLIIWGETAFPEVLLFKWTLVYDVGPTRAGAQICTHVPVEAFHIWVGAHAKDWKALKHREFLEYLNDHAEAMPWFSTVHHKPLGRHVILLGSKTRLRLWLQPLFNEALERLK